MGQCDSCPAGKDGIQGRQGIKGNQGQKGERGSRGEGITDAISAKLLYLADTTTDGCILETGYCINDANCRRKSNGCGITKQDVFGTNCEKLITDTKYAAKIKCIDGYKPHVEPGSNQECIYTCTK